MHGITNDMLTLVTSVYTACSKLSWAGLCMAEAFTKQQYWFLGQISPDRLQNIPAVLVGFEV